MSKKIYDIKFEPACLFSCLEYIFTKSIRVQFHYIPGQYPRHVKSPVEEYQNIEYLLISKPIILPLLYNIYII